MIIGKGSLSETVSDRVASPAIRRKDQNYRRMPCGEQGRGALVCGCGGDTSLG